MKYALKIGQKNYNITVDEIISGHVRVELNGKSFDVIVDSHTEKITTIPSSSIAQAASPMERPISSAAAGAPISASGSKAVIAPIPGLVTDIKVNVGDTVKTGQCVATLEAMKMENDLTAERSGVIKEIYVQKGSDVNTGQPIMLIE